MARFPVEENSIPLTETFVSSDQQNTLPVSMGNEHPNALPIQTESDASLLHLEKMAVIGYLTSSIAHELNNPIGFVSCNLRILSEYFDKLQALITLYESYHALFSTQYPQQAAEINAYMQAIQLPAIQEDSKALLDESQEGMERIKALVSQLKHYSAPGTATAFQSSSDSPATNCGIDLHVEIDGVLAMLKGELKHHFHIVTHYGTLPLLKYPSSAISQILIQLLLYLHQTRKGCRETIRILTSYQNSSAVIKLASEASFSSTSHFQASTNSHPLLAVNLTRITEIVHLIQGHIEIENDLSGEAEWTITLYFPA